MKKLILAIVAVATFAAQSIAQAPFEGTIKFDATYSGAQAEMMKSMLPNAYIMMWRGKDTKFVMEGGMTAAMMGDMITKGGESHMYMVNHTSKTVNKIPVEDKKEEKSTPPKVTKEKETAVILGYKCQKFKIEANESNTKAVIYVWATKDIKVNTVAKSKLGAGQFQFEGVEGFPLKIENQISAGGESLSIVMTASKITPGAPAATEFEIPSSYKVEEGLPAILKMGGN